MPQMPSPAIRPAEKSVPRSADAGRHLSASSRSMPPTKIVVLSLTGR